MITITREHEICCGHRVYQHEGKCKNLHGHNYKFELTLTCNELDKLGRVLDFSVVKSSLCEWLEDSWDHKMLIWEDDPVLEQLQCLESNYIIDAASIVAVPFNPTAENIAKYFTTAVAPGLLEENNCVLVQTKIWETSKCAATYSK